MDLDAVAEGFASAVRAQLGTTGNEQQNAVTCSAFLPAAVTAPHFFVADIVCELHKTFGGFTKATFTLRILAGRQDEEQASRRLRGWLSDGTGSLYAAIEGPHAAGLPQTLGGACSDLAITRIQAYRMYIHNGVPYLGAELLADVYGEKAA